LPDEKIDGVDGVRVSLHVKLLKRILGDDSRDLRLKVKRMYVLLLAFNVGAWIWALLAFHHFPLLLGTAMLAYSFGLRHAVDADHIAAIDNVTRKLMQDGKRPVAVGFFFSLGYSTMFGLGFDTATEVGLLGISATTAAKGLPIWSILVFPVLFTAGMSLIDTTDGVIMLGAYDWAFVKPLRKLYYNMTITFVSVIVALLVGGIEALGLMGSQFNLSGPFWRLIDALNDNFGTVGIAIIGIFVLSWVVAVLIYRLKRYDELDVEVS
jgi:high-affinity nickel-transport protein